MVWRPRLIKPLVVIAAGILGACAEPQLRGTPFYADDRPARADRINLWPLAYHDSPDWSVLWPLIERTDDHFAVRPFYSVYKRDKPSHQHNVLWPLAQFDRDAGRHRVFPFFWGRKSDGTSYRALFPEFYWSADRKVLFPLFWSREGFVLFPVYWRKKNELTAVVPVWSERRFPRGKSVHVLWPVFNLRAGEPVAGWRLWPLYGRYDWAGSPRSYRFALWPLVNRWERDGRVLRSVLPFYLADGTSAEGWRVWPPFLFQKRGRAGSLDLTPLWCAGRAEDADWQALFPFYYRREDRRTGARTVVTLLASRLRTPESTKWIVAPLLSSIAWGAGEKDVWALAGLARARWGGADRQSHLLPLYYHDSRQRLLLTPLYSSRQGPVGFKNWGLIAAHKDWTPEGEGLQILPPLAEFSRRGSRRVVRVLPFFSWTADGGARDLWVAPWIHLTSSGTARENRFFPFWSRVVKEGPGRKESSFRVLGWLFERRATTTAAGPPLVRTRVLWKVWDDRREGAARSIDCVPFISWDRRGDGSRRFSFLWRFIRWEAAADGRPSLDLLFIPVLRPPPH